MRRARGLTQLAAAGWIALLIAGAPGAAARTGDWVAPLVPPLRLTGTLGERRSGHLHSGIDLSTGGVIGKPVRAVAAGSIVRLRANAFGYGRALYLQTQEGPVAVYGHLSRFAPALETQLRRAQQAAGEYETDLVFEPGRFTCAPGETLAWSGATGVGPPHLHFELRRGERAQNPLRLRLAAPDLVAPSIGAIALRALGERGWVDEGLGPVRADSTMEPVRVYGPVGVECVAIDRSGTTDARLAPHSLRLSLDGELRFARAFDEADLGQGGDVERIYGRLFPEAGPWSYRLYRWPPGAPPDISDTGAGDGVIDFARVAPGLHTLCVEATDAAGRTTERECVVNASVPVSDALGGPLLPAIRVGAPQGGAGRTGTLRTRIEEALLVVEVLPDRPLAGPPQTQLVEAGGGVVPMTPHGMGPDGGWIFVLGIGGWSGESDRIRVLEPGVEQAWEVTVPKLIAYHSSDPGAGSSPGRPGVAGEAGIGPATCTLGPLTLQPAPGTFPGAACLQLWVDGAADSSARAAGGEGWPADPRAGGIGELTAISPACGIEPDWWPLESPLGVFFAPEALRAAVGAGSGDWALYRRRGDGGWSRVGREIGPLGWGARVSTPGTFAIMVDRCAPRILDPSPADGERLPRAPAQLSAALREEGAGIDPLLADILLDGRQLIAAYDPDERRLSAPVPPDAPPGEHDWEVRVTDRAGNTGTRTFRLAWPAP